MKNIYIITLISLVNTTLLLTGCGGATSSSSGFTPSIPSTPSTPTYSGITLPKETLSGKTVDEVYTQCVDKSTTTAQMSIRNSWVLYSDGTVQPMGEYFRNSTTCDPSTKFMDAPYLNTMFSYHVTRQNLGTVNGINTEKWRLSSTMTLGSTPATTTVYLITAKSGNYRCFGTNEGANITGYTTASTNQVALLTGHQYETDVPSSVDFSTLDHCIQQIK